MMNKMSSEDLERIRIGNEELKQIFYGRSLKMPNKVLDYSIVSQMHELTREWMNWYKQLWKTDRGLHNGLREGKNIIDRYNESLRNKVMMDNELYVHRGIETLNTFKASCESAKTYHHTCKDPEGLIIEMNRFIERADALIVLIEMSDHKKSIWS